MKKFNIVFAILMAILTLTNNFSLSAATTDRTNAETTSVEPVKNGYVLYVNSKGKEKKYSLERNGSNLYLNGTIIAKGISKTEFSFGFYSSKEIRYQKGSFAYKVKLSSPKKSVLYRQNVESFVISEEFHMITKEKKLPYKNDYVINSRKQSLWIHDGKIYQKLQVKNGKLLLNGKKIRTLKKSSKERVTDLGFTEDGKLFYELSSLPANPVVYNPADFTHPFDEYNLYIASVEKPKKVKEIVPLVYCGKNSYGFFVFK